MIVGCKCGKSKVIFSEPDYDYGQYYCVFKCEECGYYWEGYMGHCFTHEDIFGHEKEEKSSECDKQNTLNILVFYPGQPPVVEKTWNDLKSLQNIVGGFIEVVHLDDDLLLVCDEEGKIKGYQPNRRVGRDVICGTFFICRSEGTKFSSVTDEDLKRFR